MLGKFDEIDFSRDDRDRSPYQLGRSRGWFLEVVYYGSINEYKTDLSSFYGFDLE